MKMYGSFRTPIVACNLRVTDFTGKYGANPPGPGWQQYVAIGSLYSAGGGWYGPWKKGESKVSFLELTGKDPASADASMQGTYRVIYAATAPEVRGCFDGMNGYDNSFLSSGLMQWTVGQAGAKSQEAIGPKTSVSKGELPAFMALLKQQDSSSGSAFDSLMGALGMDVAQEWSSLKTSGGIFNFDQRKYETYFSEIQPSGPQKAVISTAQRASEMRGLHTFYRFQTAAMHDAKYRHGMWDMTRLRLREILDTPWPETVKQAQPCP